MDFIKVYGLYIIAVLIVIALVFEIIKRCKEPAAKHIIFSLCVAAENYLGSKAGKAKKAQVVSWLYGTMPVFIKIFYTMSDFERLIDEAALTLDQALKSGEYDLTEYKEEQKNIRMAPVSSSIPMPKVEEEGTSTILEPKAMQLVETTKIKTITLDGQTFELKPLE